MNTEASLLKLIEKTALFLRDRQVLVEPMVFTKERHTHTYRPYQYAEDHILTCEKRKDMWQYRCGNTWEDIPIGVPFRLKYDTPDTFSISPSHTKSYKGIRQKITRYKGYHDFWKRVALFISKEISLFRIYDKWKYAQNTAIQKELYTQEGITFVASIDDNGECLTLVCIDTGGIYDTNLNSEGRALPPQVPVDCYSTEYAAYVFFWMWRRTHKVEWWQACIRAVEFFLKTSQFPYTHTMFDHYEFKVLPLAALVYDIEKEATLPTEFPLLEVRAVLRDQWYSYDPVNVSALRVANGVLCRTLGILYLKSKVHRSVKRIRNNQTAQGLIQDNTGGAVVQSADLTYHQFALACLRVAASLSENTHIHTLVDKGLHFSRSIQRPDGHVSYVGRGANNVYHLASYIYAETGASDYSEERIAALIAYLEKYASEKDGFPTALNSERETRMGWNHCAVPYNGQSSFFLCLAYDNIQKKIGKTTAETHQNMLHRKTGRCDYAVLSTSRIHAVIGRGADQYVWGEGTRYIGMGGLCSLSIDGVSLLLANDYSIRQEVWTSDMPQQTGNYTIRDAYVGQLTSFQESAMLVCNGWYVTYTLSQEDNQLTMTYEKKKHTDQYDMIGALSFLNAVVAQTTYIDNGYEIQFHSGFGIRVTTEHTEFKLKKVPIHSNPFGKGFLFGWDISSTTCSLFSFQIEIV